MREVNHDQLIASPDAERKRRIAGMPILRELRGHMCAHCGNPRYFLVFRMTATGGSGTLTARCSRCRQPRVPVPGEIERECHFLDEEPLTE
jgi:hypothetical protein